jgi:hypothetical protein
MTTRTRLILALAASLALVALAWLCPSDGASRGPAVLSVLGKWHLLALHLPAALLIVLPVVELAHPEASPSRPVRILADLAAAGTWAATALGILHGHYNGFSGTEVDRHLQLGVVAAALAGLAWALMGLGRRARIALQCLAALGVILAAHLGGEMVHGENFLTEPSKPDAEEARETTSYRGFSLIPTAMAATPKAEGAEFAPNAEVAKVAESLVRQMGVTALPRAVESDAGLLVATHAIAGQFGDTQFAKLSEQGRHIAELDLSRARLTDAAAASLARFTHLEALVLGDTKVGDAVAVAAARLPHLRRVVLRGTLLTDAGLAALGKAPALETLYVAQTKCTPGAIEALRKSRPGLRIVGEVSVKSVTVPAPPTKEEMMKATEAARKK